MWSSIRRGSRPCRCPTGRGREARSIESETGEGRVGAFSRPGPRHRHAHRRRARHPRCVHLLRAAGSRPISILQSIASGLLGRAAYQGGMRTALLGLLLHFFIAFASTRLPGWRCGSFPSLNRHPWIYGLLYGLAVYAVMNLVVIPFSAAALGSGPTPAIVRVNGVLIHMFGVGLPRRSIAARTVRENRVARGSNKRASGECGWGVVGIEGS